jgi:hypothetical protein
MRVINTSSTDGDFCCHGCDTEIAKNEDYRSLLTFSGKIVFFIILKPFCTELIRSRTVYPPSTSELIMLQSLKFYIFCQSTLIMHPHNRTCF